MELRNIHLEAKKSITASNKKWKKNSREALYSLLMTIDCHVILSGRIQKLPRFTPKAENLLPENKE